MEEKPNYFAIIPAEVRYDSDLKDKAKLLYGEIVALSNKDGVCYASNKYFADLYDITITTVSLLIKDLIEKGYLESEFSYKENSKEIEHRYLKIIKGGYLKNIKGGIKEKLKGNNTSINNTSINIKQQDNNEVYSIYENEIGSLSTRQFEILENYRKVLSDELIIRAIEITKDNNACSFNYLKAILEEWKNKGYKCIGDIQTPLKNGIKYEKRVVKMADALCKDEKEYDYEELDGKELEELEKEMNELFDYDWINDD